jgi:hypothetical protein
VDVDYVEVIGDMESSRGNRWRKLSGSGSVSGGEWGDAVT